MLVDHMKSALASLLVLLCCAGSSLAQDHLFSFLPGKWAAMSKDLPAGSRLVVSVTDMKPGQKLVLQRCGTERCNVAEPVAIWTLSDLEGHGSAEVNIEGGRYHFTMFDQGRGVAGVLDEVENGATVLRYESGTTVSVTIRLVN